MNQPSLFGTRGPGSLGKDNRAAVSDMFAAKRAQDKARDAGNTPRFAGADYVPARDDARLSGQIARVFAFMQGGAWHTLNEIAQATGDPHASVSAQLRHLRKERFGGHAIEKRHRGDPALGVYEYSMVVEQRKAG